jgi:putative CocE/NonD family hydrolase
MKLTTAIRTTTLVMLICTGNLHADERVPFPEPNYAFEVERDVRVPMRDGVRLATDLYRPAGAGKKLPVILIRTQYGKQPYFDSDDPFYGVAKLFAGQGFLVAVQEIRGRFGSEGQYRLGLDDARDGYDAVDWLAKQPWSNGRIGTYGCSSLGNTQIIAAQLRHPNLAAMIPQGCGGASIEHKYDVFTSGVPEIGWSLEWFREDGAKQAGIEIPKIDYAPILRSLPVRDMAAKAGGPPNDWVDWMTRSPGDPWWDRYGFFKDDSVIDVPTLLVNSWYDMSSGSTLHMFNRFRENAPSARARDNQYIIIAPTDHCEAEFVGASYTFRDRELGDARKDFWSIYLRWFDRWLRGNERALDGLPKVQYYLMGRNEWRSAPSWPVPDTKFTKYFLGGAGRANSRFGDGTLSLQPGSAGQDSYFHDPGFPFPSRGMNAGGGTYDQREVEMRNDVLVYTSPVLEHGVDVTGPLEVVLYVSSSAVDTDFTAKLIDVYPDGTAFEIRSGIARARYRQGYDRDVWMEPGKVYELRVKLQDTSNYFGPGHRIRVDIASASFTRFARNLNTGGNGYDETSWIVARNVVHHGVDHPSHILLPVIEEQE